MNNAKRGDLQEFETFMKQREVAQLLCVTWQLEFPLTPFSVLRAATLNSFTATPTL